MRNASEIVDGEISVDGMKRLGLQFISWPWDTSRYTGDVPNHLCKTKTLTLCGKNCGGFKRSEPAFTASRLCGNCNRSALKLLRKLNADVGEPE